MKKYFFLLILFLPVLSFGQLQKNEKIAIENYSEELCTCVDELMNTLGSKTIDFIRVMTLEGMEALEKSLAEYYQTVTEEEFNKQIAFFDVMNSKAFQDKIETCDNKSGMSKEVVKSIDDNNGESSEYFLGYLKYHVNCEVTDLLLKVARDSTDGGSEEKN